MNEITVFYLDPKNKKKSLSFASPKNAYTYALETSRVNFRDGRETIGEVFLSSGINLFVFINGECYSQVSESAFLVSIEG